MRMAIGRLARPTGWMCGTELGAVPTARRLRPMTPLRNLALAIALTSALAPLPAQGVSAIADASAPPPLAEQIAASRELMVVLMPPSYRDDMIDGMVQMIDRVMHQIVDSNAGLTATLRKKPGAEEVFTRFVERQMTSTRRRMTERMPALVEAMTVAYARQFTVEQIKDMQVFFSTPTGQAYIRQSAHIMADPAIAEWQATSVKADMAEMPAKLQQLMDELEALDIKPGKHDT